MHLLASFETLVTWLVAGFAVWMIAHKSCLAHPELLHSVALLCVSPPFAQYN